MGKRNKTNSSGLNEIDAMLAGIEADMPEGLLALRADELLAGEETFVEIMTDESGEKITVRAVEEDFDDLLMDAESPVKDDVEGDGGTKVVDPDIAVIDKSAYYEAQESTTAVSSDEDATPVAKSKRKPKVTAEATEKAPKTPRVVTTGMSRSEVLIAKANLSDLSKIGVEEDKIDGIIATMNALPAKVQDKAYNMLRYLAGRDTLSNYTRFVVEQLSSGGAMSVPEIVTKMETRGWSSGTSRSQSQQVHRLFAAYDMLESPTGTMELKSDNPFVAAIVEKLYAKAA